jgi:hypothetical protein
MEVESPWRANIIGSAADPEDLEGRKPENT